MFMKPRVLLSLAVVLAMGAAASAQSLADIARQEEARRKAVRTPGKLYTNDSVRPEPTPSSGGATSTQTPSPAPEAAAQPPAGDAAPSADTAKKDEAYWKKRMADVRSALDRSQTFADALQSRVNALTNDFVARDDPAQRAQIAADRDKALAELDRVKKEITTSQKAITDTQDEARKAGVPAGWVR